MRRAIVSLLLLALEFPLFAETTTAPEQKIFLEGKAAYQKGDYATAAEAFWRESTGHPASGSFLNLGLAEWQRGETGQAILAWERALWIQPLNEPVRNNLRFVRKIAQLEAPESSWYEVVSGWLPASAWAWLTALSLWGLVAMLVLPPVFSWRKAGWHQALAALALTIFLLSLPAHLGIERRMKLGFVLRKDAPLLLTPTSEGQVLGRLPAGEPARVERAHRGFLLVRTNHARGWLARADLELVCSKPGAK